MPTREQLIQNIEAMESQGASQPEIQEYLDSFETAAPAKPPFTVSPNVINHGGVPLLARLANAVSQPFTSLAATPVQALAKATGQPDPYAQGFPALGGQGNPVTPLTVKGKAGDVLKVGATVASIATAPTSVPALIATGAGIGAAQGAGEALQQDLPARDVIDEAVRGGTRGGAFAGALGIVGKLAGALGEKIQTSIIRPTKLDIEDGFSMATVKKHNLGGPLTKSYEKTKKTLADFTNQLSSKLAASKEKVDLERVYQETVDELTDASKLKGFGANIKIQNTLESLRNEVAFVGKELNIPDAQVVKQASGSFGAWQYGKQDPDAKATEIVFNTFYSKLKTAIEKASPEGVSEINAQLSELIPVMNAIIRRLPVEARNNAISLNEMIGLVASSINPVALGPTLLAILSRSGAAAQALSKSAPVIERAAIPVAGATGLQAGQ